MAEVKNTIYDGISCLPHSVFTSSHSKLWSARYRTEKRENCGRRGGNAEAIVYHVQLYGMWISITNGAGLGRLLRVVLMVQIQAPTYLGTRNDGQKSEIRSPFQDFQDFPDFGISRISRFQKFRFLEISNKFVTYGPDHTCNNMNRQGLEWLTRNSKDNSN